MKTLGILLAIGIFCYPGKKGHASMHANLASAPAQQIAPLVFARDIQPILRQHCVPCHFPGGKMYGRLPFDTASTILRKEVQPVLLKRIRDQKENELIRKFISQQQQTPGS